MSEEIQQQTAKFDQLGLLMKKIDGFLQVPNEPVMQEKLEKLKLLGSQAIETKTNVLKQLFSKSIAEFSTIEKKQTTVIKSFP